ncbi:MAG: exodeoxyribonuclease V subunit gamma [Bernardetiaceae bacterium]|nr:exodeoxyribonuclease V subunit gamma [Bernardetiaceae bacterium]
MSELLAHLNPVQRQAVTHLDGPLMIIAGAGSGKTRVITHRIAFLHREVGIPLGQIMAVTFTNKAAKEMRERICRILGLPDMPGLAVGTFHARCAMILRREAEAAGLSTSFAILDETDQKQAIKGVLKELDISEKLARPAKVQSFINQAKMRLLTPADCEELNDEDEVPYPRIYAKYQEVLTKCNSVDFEDLLMKTVLLFQGNEAIRKRWVERYQYVLVDEYQDTNHAQFLLTKLLAKDHGNICIVGDEDQSIYSWRGAEISNLLEFEKSFPGTHVIKLEQNYRSTATILRAASTVIERNTQRIGKTLFTEGEEGEPLTFMTSPDQAGEGTRIAQECVRLIKVEGVNPDEIAIFYRGHWLSRGIEDAMRQFRIPYRVVGGLRFYDRREVKDLLSLLRLSVNPTDDLAFERVVNVPNRGIGAKSQLIIAQHAAAMGVSWREAAIALTEQKTLRGKAHGSLINFLGMLDGWVELARFAKPSRVLEQILKDTNYKEDGVGDLNSIEAESRLENIGEFEGMIDSYQPQGTENQLLEFLTEMALDATEEKDDNKARVSLLTIHNAKGLEYDYVFTIGMEKGVFPTSRAEESFDAMAVEEERRLFYVAITRARKKLFLSYSMSRNRPDLWGSMNQPSIFLSELPSDVFDGESQQRMKRLLPYQTQRQKQAPGELEYVPDEPVQTERRPFRSPGGPINRGGRTASRPGFSEGTRVNHRYMGPGEVVSLGGRPGWERVKVRFDDGREQEFVLKYAPLSLAE